jgi:hypothetical protein
MTPAAPAVATGLSIGTIALVGGVILVAGAIIYLNNSKKKGRSNSSSQGSINKILTDENRYKGDKLIIEDAIREKDWETLEDMLKSRTSDFPDLIKMIKKALNNRK